LLAQVVGLAAALGPDHVITTCLPGSLLVQVVGLAAALGPDRDHHLLTWKFVGPDGGAGHSAGPDHVITNCLPGTLLVLVAGPATKFVLIT
jgi:hypothetical protein